MPRTLKLYQSWGFGISVAMMVYVLKRLVMQSRIPIFLGPLTTTVALAAYFVAWEHEQFWPWMVDSSTPSQVANVFTGLL